MINVLVAAPEECKRIVSEVCEKWVSPRARSVRVLYLKTSQAQDPKANAQLILKVEEGGVVMFVGSCKLIEQTSSRVVHRFTVQEFKQKANAIFVSRGVDVASIAAEELRNCWRISAVGRDGISAWLSQFEEFGDFGWIGRSLLKCLTAVTVEQLVGSLFCSVEDEKLRYFSPDSDARGGITGLAQCVAKRCELKGVQLTQDQFGRLTALSWKNVAGRVLVEDCSISGTEFERVLDRVDEQYDNEAVTLRFGVLANGASARIHRLLREKELVNVHLDESRSIRIETLTNDGYEAMAGNSFYATDGTCLNSRQYLVPGIFSNHAFWGGRKKVQVARKWLKKIGAQLQVNAKKAEGRFGSYVLWPQKKKDLWSEGAGGYALGIVLPHSIPKSSHPVIWGSGTVRVRNREIQWRPLVD